MEKNERENIFWEKAEKIKKIKKEREKKEMVN